jgi:hypothetical protein
MVPSISPSVHPRAGFEALFRNAFTADRRDKYVPLSSIDNAPNEACGDSIDPNFDGLYVWSNNVNTLSLNNELADLHELCRQFKENRIGIAALQELNIDMTQSFVYHKVKAVFDEHFDKQCILVCSTTAIRSATTWKPGSTLLVILPKWTPYVVARFHDDLGRWCSVTLQAKDHRQLVFYSFYNCCCKTTIEQSGIHMIFAQQWHVLRQRADKAPDPRLQAVNDLKHELAVHKHHARSICILRDFNEDVGSDPALMASVCCAFNLVDTMDTVHPDESHVPSYARSSNRLDYACLSADLLPDLLAVGLLHYHDFYPSDHRPIFVGLGATLFGPLPSIVPQQFRLVHSNSKLIGKFVELAYKHLEDTGSFGRINSLFHDDAAYSDPDFSALADSIDDQITRALLSAERKCKTPQREPWSEAVHFASLHVKYWRLKGASLRNHYNASDTLTAILSLLPQTHAITEDPTLTDKQQLNAAHRFLTRTRKDATALRADFLQELQERIAMRKTPADMDREASLKCIEKQLRQTTKFSNIKQVLCPSTHAPLTKVTVTTTEHFIDPVTGHITSHQSVEVVDTKAALESRILARNKKHFAQAQGTTFTHEPFLSMTPDNIGQHFDLDGNPINLPAGTFTETTTVLKLLRAAFADRPPGIDHKVSFDDFIGSFLHWHEKTSTSPSGRHLGLYKSLITAHCDSGKEFQDCSDDAPSIQNKATAVLDAIHRILTGVAQRGLYLQRWIFVINAMIYKKAGVLELDELRVIHLFEADFNLLVGLIFGRRTVHNAVNH